MGVWSLTTGQINALCAANSWDPTYYRIFVDPGLLVFPNVLGKLVAECLERGNAVEGDTLDLMQVKAPGTKTVAVKAFADFLRYAHDDEYQADIVGAIVTVETLIRLEMPGMFNCLAPYIFLKSVETREVCSRSSEWRGR